MEEPKTIEQLKNNLVEALQAHETSPVSLKSDKMSHLSEVIQRGARFIDKLPEQIRFGKFVTD